MRVRYSPARRKLVFARGCTASRALSTRPQLQGVSPMLDLIMLAIGLGFFALSIGYSYACDRL